MAKRKRDPRLDEAGLSPDVRWCIDALVHAFPLTPYPERITYKNGEIWDEGQTLNAVLVNRSWIEVTRDEWEMLLSELIYCFMDVDALAYFLPGILRMALIDKEGWAGSTAGFILDDDNERRQGVFAHYNSEQVQCIERARHLIALAERWG